MFLRLFQNRGGRGSALIVSGYCGLLAGVMPLYIFSGTRRGCYTYFWVLRRAVSPDKFAVVSEVFWLERFLWNIFSSSLLYFVLVRLQPCFL